jgi:hypothetical protein
MPKIVSNIAEIDDRIAIVRDNLRELVEQAAAYSGAADEELMSRRIAEQEAQLELLRKQREELARRGPPPGGVTLMTSTHKPARNEMGGNRIRERMEVIGADGVHVGTVDRVNNGRIRLAQTDSGEGRHKGHYHFIDLGLVAAVEGQKVRLSANAAVAVTFEEEQTGKPI